MTHEQNIGKHTRVTVAVAIAGIVVCASGVLEWANLKADVRQIAHDQWTINDQLRWTSEMQKLNPSLNVPIPTMPLALSESARTNAIMAATLRD